MKKFILATALSAIIATAFALSSRENISTAETGRVVTSEYFTGQRISGIEAGSLFEVKLIKSSETKVVVDADGEIAPYVRASNNDGHVKVWHEVAAFDEPERSILGIRFSRKKTSNINIKMLRVTVYTPLMERIKLSGVAELSSDSIFVSENMQIELSGIASIKNLDIDTERLYITCSGSSNANITANSRTSEVKVSGTADVKLSGGGRDLKVTAGGTSNLNSSRFTAENAEVSASGTSDIKIVAANIVITTSGAADVDVSTSESIAVKASGTSDVKYTGGAIMVRQNVSGAADVKKY